MTAYNASCSCYTPRSNDEPLLYGNHPSVCAKCGGPVANSRKQDSNICGPYAEAKKLAQEAAQQKK
ncbi:uncharacterized protein EHS24_008613 [Apiotrichum porosum]|uniref:Uncharacterized protein n=1 Tax=Apiotrichum porosum TaxID=105984 RepID=A0A427XQP0_9TREE|nr:uncharacterized protein EHS24_008613 [Apiotrichum porosum]RSH81176.1 hypothetical protein EHS24_008613 [Apiotrichum porosum]